MVLDRAFFDLPTIADQKDHFKIAIDIIQGKIWIQHDATNRPVAEELLEDGVPKEDIILGFHPPQVRQYTDFGVA